MTALHRAYELGLFLLFVLVAFVSWRRRGAIVTARELLFGFVLTQTVEAMAVAYGRYRYPDWLVYLPVRPAVPLAVGLGWACLLPPLMFVTESILGRGASRVRLAALDGLLAVALDLVLDPTVSGPPLNMWVWRGPGMTPYSFWLLDVPVFNFVGWFLLVFAASVQLRAVRDRGPRAPVIARLAVYLACDLAVAAAVMRLPW